MTKRQAMAIADTKIIIDKPGILENLPGIGRVLVKKSWCLQRVNGLRVYFEVKKS